MVITVFWMPSWTVPIISVSILCVAAMFLLCCFCIQRRRNETLKLGSAPRGKFFNFSNNSLNKLMTFRNYDEGKNDKVVTSLPGEESDKLETDSDSEDTFHKFGSSCLRISDAEDDAKSCVSGDSRFTFYSTYPCVTRSGSNTSDITFKSARNSLVKIPSGTNKILVV